MAMFNDRIIINSNSMDAGITLVEELNKNHAESSINKKLH